MTATADARLRARMGDAFEVDALGVNVSGVATLASPYPVSDLAAASVATTAAALTSLLAELDLDTTPATLRRELVDAWFRAGVRPVGWIAPSPWDPLAGDFEASDGWVRLHTNAPAHREAALRVLGVDPDPDAVARAVRLWRADDLESEVVAAGGCAARMRRPDEWRRHEQGAAVAAEPLVAWEPNGASDSATLWRPRLERPLEGLRVLDLTRVIAGPVATRLLAGLGATVLRLDPPGWDEPGVVHDMTLGKRTARLDAHSSTGRDHVRRLVAECDVIVHGYRPGALDSLGLGSEVRAQLRPGLVDVSLDAYGHTGPWAGRRGFDSLVQMSSGIADAGMRASAGDRPTPLPVQALDHATGYLTAAAVLVGLRRRRATGEGTAARLSLARTAFELEDSRGVPRATPSVREEPAEGELMQSQWGPVRVLPAPFEVAGVRIAWDRPPRDLGSDNPGW